MTSNDEKKLDKLITEHRNDLSPPEVIVKAMNYPPGYPDDKQKEQCNKKDEKHKNCHPMHCHHIQPMQSATNALFIDTNLDHTQQDSKK